MKIQYLAIIFLIVIIPITLVLTIYNQSQINNLNLQLSYNSKVLDATHNAVKAFELNTVNNKYSQVADSLKRDVEAAANVFLNSMAKNLGTSGASSKSISEYVPAILFTLYDGYYIYAPAYAEVLQEQKAINGESEITIETSKTPADIEFSHMLKPYVYYSMRYVASNIDVVVNYSLDSYITVCGNINGKYVTKSGYLLQTNDTNNLKDVSITIDQKKLYTVFLRDILKFYLPNGELVNETIEDINYIYDDKAKSELKNYINFSEKGVYRTSLISDLGETVLDKMLSNKYVANGGAINGIDLADIPISKIDQKFEKEQDYIQLTPDVNGPKIDKVLDCFTVKLRDKEITDVDAKSYYVKALQFSNWVNSSGLEKIQAQNARDVNGNELSEFSGNQSYILKTKNIKNNNPEDETSDFVQHKIVVIKNSIQANLTSAIARYNQSFFGLKHGYDLKMPVLTDNEWDAITKKVTMVTFMQGMIIGNKVFNDYAVVSSAKNKEFVDINELYYFDKKSSGKVYYHRIDCPELIKESEKPDAEIVGYKSIEFEIYKTKDEDNQLAYEYGEEIEKLRNDFCETEVIEGKIVRKRNDNGYFIFREGAIEELVADYDCLVDGNYTPDFINISLLFAQKTAIARERNKHYKVNGYMDSNDIQYKKKNIVLTPSTTDYTKESVNVSLNCDMDNIKYYINDENNEHKAWTLNSDATGNRFANIDVSTNCTIYAYSEEEPGRVASLEITNIDKTAPSEVLISVDNASIAESQFELKMSAKDELSGISEYELHVEMEDTGGNTGGKYLPYIKTISSGKNSENWIVDARLRGTQYNCYVIVKDVAGNSTRSNTIQVTTN